MNIKEICEIVNGTFIGDNEERDIIGISSLNLATEKMLSFVVKQAYCKDAVHSDAAAIFVKSGWQIEGKSTIEVDDPYLAYAQVAQHFEDRTPLFGDSIHSTAFVDESAMIGNNCVIGPNSSIGANVIIGTHCKIDANVVIEKDVTIGDNVYIHSGAVIRYGCTVGNNCIISSNAVVGSEGFANAFHNGEFTRIPCFGSVVLEDDVEIGASTTIDRGNFEDTVIKKGSRIDNLVQVAHNVTIGESCGIAAQAGFAGSTKIGNRVMVAGQVGMAGHLTIGDDTFIAAQAGVPSSLEGGAAYAGSPCLPMREQRRVEMSWKKLPKMLKEIRDLKKEVEQLRENR